MTEQQMRSAVQSLRLADYKAIKSMIDFMQSTHASDHITPTHVNRAADRPKSFYMKRAEVNEQQGWKTGTVGWGGKQGLVKNEVKVAGVVSAQKVDEAEVIKLALKMPDYMMFSADDQHGPKCLLVTGIPAGYAGYSYPTKAQAGFGVSNDSTALPIEVHYNVVVVRAGTNTKFLSTYPAPQWYIDGLGTGYVG